MCGNDFPSVEELKGFDLVIHCGACMFNRKHVMSRIAGGRSCRSAITNYGVVLAKLTGILDKIELPADNGRVAAEPGLADERDKRDERRGAAKV